MELNGIDAFEEEHAARPPIRERALRRGAYLLPGAFTVANLLCGYYAILATLEGRAVDMDNAARAIGFAIVFDFLDGRVARALNANSEFGKEFDSLADVISFGIAPAFLAYAWGVRSLPLSDVGEAFHIYQMGWLVSFVFVVSCAWRLARFNLRGMASGGSGYFVGMPTPAAAGMVAATVHFFSNPIQSVKTSLLWLLLLLGLALLMSSTIRHVSFKNIRWDRKQSSRALVLIALLIGLIVFYSRPVLLLLGSVYTAHGVLMATVRLIRRRFGSRPA